MKIVGEGVSLKKLEVRQIHSDFDPVGSFECSSPVINRLQEITRVSYLANFVGIPTDCPHREKNGWTGDAQIACETGLYNFNSASSYNQWIDTLRDVQRLNGRFRVSPPQVDGDTTGATDEQDGALFVIIQRLPPHRRRLSALRNSYDAMRKYLEFCPTMCDPGDDIIMYG